MENDDLNKKLEQALLIQSRIEERMKFIEENSETLTDKQLSDLFNLIANIEESLSPELKDIEKDMEENFNKIKDEGQNAKNEKQ